MLGTLFMLSNNTNYYVNFTSSGYTGLGDTAPFNVNVPPNSTAPGYSQNPGYYYFEFGSSPSNPGGFQVTASLLSSQPQPGAPLDVMGTSGSIFVSPWPAANMSGRGPSTMLEFSAMPSPMGPAPQAYQLLLQQPTGDVGGTNWPVVVLGVCSL